MKKSVVISFLLFICSCATQAPKTDLTKNPSELGSDSKKEIQQDVKSIDYAYSKSLEANSSFKKVRTKYDCKDYSKIDKKEWRDLLEAGRSCIDQKSWGILSEIAATLSHNHLKAPWGPYYRSIVAESKNDFSRAMWMINLAERKAPNNNIILYQKARLLWLMGEETSSFELMKKVVKANPKNYDALLFLGNVQYRDREFKAALSYFEKVYKFKYKDPELRAAMGESYFFENKFEKSIGHYKAAVAGEKLNASLYYKIGLAYKNLKNWKYAKSYFEKAISQRRKGRSFASFSDDKVRAALEEVNKHLDKPQGGENEKSI